MKYVSNKTRKILCDIKQNYDMAENLKSSKNLLHMTKHHMLSYSTHFLKIGGYLFGINFLANKIRQCKPLARRNVFYSLFSTNKTKL